MRARQRQSGWVLTTVPAGQPAAGTSDGVRSIRARRPGVIDDPAGRVSAGVPSDGSPSGGSLTKVFHASRSTGSPRSMPWPKGSARTRGRSTDGPSLRAPLEVSWTIRESGPPGSPAQ